MYLTRASPDGRAKSLKHVVVELGLAWVLRHSLENLRQVVHNRRHVREQRALAHDNDAHDGWRTEEAKQGRQSVAAGKKHTQRPRQTSRGALPFMMYSFSVFSSVASALKSAPRKCSR